MHSEPFSIHYLPHSQTVQASVEKFVAEWKNPSSVLLTHTSGSTGTPKSIPLPKKKMLQSAQMTVDFLDLKRGEKALLCLSVETIGGKMMILRALEFGLDLLVGPLNSDPLLSIEEKIDFVAMVPLQLSNSLKSSVNKLRSIKRVIVGGAPVSISIIEELKNHKLTVYHTFGMTETISHIALRKVGYETEPFYTAIGDTSFEEKGGCLVVNSSQLLKGSITTNDCIKLIDNKRFIWLGRSDFTINSGGVKIHPEQIERKIETLFKVSYFIGSLPDDYLGEKVVLCMESSSGEIPSKQQLESHLSPYEMPREIHSIPSFVRTMSGKINRIETLSLLKI
jgi:o-succinylbenzoate---CoA ligase